MTTAPSPRDPAAPPRLSGNRTLVILAAAFLGILVIGALVSAASQPEPPLPPCPADGDCGGPPEPEFPSAAAPTVSLPPVVVSNAPRLELGKAWQSTARGFRILYNANIWHVAYESANHVALEGAFRNGPSFGVIVDGASAADFGPQALMDAELDVLRGDWAPDLQRTTDVYYLIQSPSIGGVDGPTEGATYKGHATGTDGTPGQAVAASIIAASDGRITVAVVVWTVDPDRRSEGSRFTRDYTVRSLVDDILKDFQWSTG